MSFKFYLHLSLLLHIKEYLSFKKKLPHFCLPKFCCSNIRPSDLKFQKQARFTCKLKLDYDFMTIFCVSTCLWDRPVIGKNPPLKQTLKNNRIHFNFYLWWVVVRALTNAKAEYSHKIIIKFQLTGKSRLILKFYFLTFCVSIANKTSKSKCNLIFIPPFLGISIKETYISSQKKR